MLNLWNYDSMKYNRVSKGIMEKLPSVPNFPIEDWELHASSPLRLWLTLGRGEHTAWMGQAQPGQQHRAVPQQSAAAGLWPHKFILCQPDALLNKNRAESWWSWLLSLLWSAYLGFLQPCCKTGATTACGVLWSSAEVWWCTNIGECGV